MVRCMVQVRAVLVFNIEKTEAVLAELTRTTIRTSLTNPYLPLPYSVPRVRYGRYGCPTFSHSAGAKIWPVRVGSEPEF